MGEEAAEATAVLSTATFVYTTSVLGAGINSGIEKIKSIFQPEEELEIEEEPETTAQAVLKGMLIGTVGLAIGTLAEDPEIGIAKKLVNMITAELVAVTISGINKLLG